MCNKFNIIEFLKLLKGGVYLFLIYILIRAGVYHTSIDILEKVVTPSEKKIYDKNMWANLVYELTNLGYRHRKETNIRIITKKYNTYFYTADSRRHSKYNPLNPYSLKLLKQRYKLTQVRPENPIEGYKLKLLTREETVSALATKRNIAIETLKTNAYCKQFYIKNYPEIFDTRHKFDTVPSNTDEWIPILKSFIDGSKIHDFLESYYTLSIEPFVFKFFFEFMFWAVYPGILFWSFADMKAAFDLVADIGLGIQSNRPNVIPFYTKIWNHLLENPSFVEFWKTLLPQDELDLFNASLQDRDSTPKTDIDSGDNGRHQ
jgi:hypothetical protein